MSCFTALLRLRVERLYCLGTNVECFRGIDKARHTFGFPVIYSHRHKPLGPSRSRPTLSRVAWWGGPPEIKYESCECFVVMPRWVFIWFFPRLIVRVLLF